MILIKIVLMLITAPFRVLYWLTKETGYLVGLVGLAILIVSGLVIWGNIKVFVWDVFIDAYVNSDKGMIASFIEVIFPGFIAFGQITILFLIISMATAVINVAIRVLIYVCEIPTRIFEWTLNHNNHELRRILVGDNGVKAYILKKNKKTKSNTRSSENSHTGTNTSTNTGPKTNSNTGQTSGSGKSSYTGTNTYAKQKTFDGWYAITKGPSHAAYIEAMKMYGVSYPYTQDTIKKKRNTLMKISHPDEGGNEAYATKINVNYDILCQFLSK